MLLAASTSRRSALVALRRSQATLASAPRPSAGAAMPGSAAKGPEPPAPSSGTTGRRVEYYWSDIPAVPSWPIVGSLPHLLKYDPSPEKIQFHLATTKAHADYGRVYRAKLNSPGSEWTVLVADPQVAADVMRADARAPFRPTPGTWRWYREQHNFPLGLIASNGEEWRRIRSAVQDLVFKPQVVTKLFLHELHEPASTLMVRLGETLKAHGESALQGKENVNIDAVVQRWSIDTACRVVLGQSIGVQDTPPNPLADRMISVIYDFFGPNSSAMRQPEAAWKYGLTEVGRKHMAAVHEFHTLTHEIMDNTLKVFAAKPEKIEGTFLGFLMKQDASITQTEMMTTASDFLNAGIDTLARTVLTMLYLLGNNPEVQAKLRAEVLAIVGDDPNAPLEAQHLTQLKYMKNVVKEATRMFPAVPINARIPQSDIVAGGYEIPAKTEVLLNGWAMSYDPTLVRDPETFDPDRWDAKRGAAPGAEVVDAIHPGVSMPFGAGSRMCLGRRLAEMELYAFLTHFVRRYEMSACPDKLDLVYGLGLSNRGPMPLRFRSLQ